MGVPLLKWLHVYQKEENKSGKVSVQIIDKSDGYHVFKTVGSSSDAEEVNRLVKKAEHILYTHNGEQIVLPLERRKNVL